MSKISSLFSRILGFIVIIITLSLGSTIYTANASIVSANLTNLIGMSAISGFGAFIIIFGLLISGGVLQFNLQGQGSSRVSRNDIFVVVLSVGGVVLALSFFTYVIDYTNTLITSAIAASDNLGTVGFGIIPIIIYLGIIAAAGWAQVRTIRRARRNRKAARAAMP